jgi:hypothetical protein
MASNNQRVSQPGKGDFTGREKARQSREAAAAQKERSANTTMATAAQAYEEEHGVFDPMSGQRIDGPEVTLLEVDDDDDFEDDERPFGGGHWNEDDDEPVLSGQETEEELAPILATQKEPKKRRRHTEQAYNSMVVVRLDQDIDDMTYGMDQISMSPKNYTFKEGLKYKIPYEVAEHLDERGLVRQWVSK